MGIDSFIHKKDYEKVLFQMRRHGITFLPALFFFLLMLALPVVLYFLLQEQFNTWANNTTVYIVLVMLMSAYELGVLLFFYSYFLDYYLDVFIVTNDRLVDVEQNGLFARTVAEVDLYQIQDVTSDVKGIIATMFNYGGLVIQTAGALPKFTIHDIKDPHHMREVLLNLAEDDRKYHQT
jgi:Bacterial PH domain